MKQYPQISRQYRNIPIYAYDKLDGSNIRAEWHPKKDLWKYGSLTVLIDEGSPLGESISLIKQYEDVINKELKGMRTEGATLFFEYYGAILGISFMQDKKAIPYLKEAMRKEKVMNLNEDIKQVLDMLNQLED